MSLLSFVMPSVFRPYLQHLQTAFRHSHYTTSSEAVGDYHMEQVSRAKEIMRPFILRRLKKEVVNGYFIGATVHVHDFGHWMCGESWYHQRPLTHHSQFSRLGIQCPTLIYMMFV